MLFSSSTSLSSMLNCYFCISLTWFRIFEEKKSTSVSVVGSFFVICRGFCFCVELRKHFTHWLFFNVAIWNHFLKKRKNDEANEFILMANAKESSQNKHRNEWTTICTATGCNDGKNKKWRNWRCTLVDHQQKKYYKNHLITTRFIFSSFISLQLLNLSVAIFFFLSPILLCFFFFFYFFCACLVRLLFYNLCSHTKYLRAIAYTHTYYHNESLTWNRLQFLVICFCGIQLCKSVQRMADYRTFRLDYISLVHRLRPSICSIRFL